MSHLMPLQNRTLDQTCLQAESCQKTQAIVVVDVAVNNYQDSLASHLLGMDIHILKAEEDGIAQLQTLLPLYQHLSGLHLICQGAPGQLQLGTTLLSEINLWAYADDIRQWRDSLNDNAEIFIYGCDLAANRVGQAFVSWLKFLTGAGIKVL
mgnify:CR=1 FL=1